MGKLGGAFIIAFIMLMCLLMGGWWFISKIREFFTRGKRSIKDKETLGSIFTQLHDEGFFKSTDEPRVIKNRIVSEALSEASKHEGFFWGMSKKNIFIKENPNDENYDSILVYGNNSIGFHWRGQL